MAWYGIVWNGMVWYQMVYFGMVWYRVCYGMLHQRMICNEHTAGMVKEATVFLASIPMTSKPMVCFGILWLLQMCGIFWPMPLQTGMEFTGCLWKSFAGSCIYDKQICVMVWKGMVFAGMVSVIGWYMVWCDRYGWHMVWCGMTWYGGIGMGDIWYGGVWHGMVFAGRVSVTGADVRSDTSFHPQLAYWSTCHCQQALVATCQRWWFWQTTLLWLWIENCKKSNPSC